jgi:hypothetical protein
MHRKLQILGNYIGEALNRLKLGDLEETEFIPISSDLKIKIVRKYFTDRFWTDRIMVEGSKYVGSIYVDCFHKALTVGEDSSIHEFECSNISNYPEYAREMRKNQKDLYPLTEKIDNAISDYVEEKMEETK